MDWRARTGTGVLSGIIALLLSLADMAERAAASPCAVRFRVLGILRYGESVAYSSLGAVARDLGAPMLPQPASVASPMLGDTPSDALLVAVRLRALALVWLGLLTWLRKIVRRQTRKGLVTPALFRAVAEFLPNYALALPPIDTS